MSYPNGQIPSSALVQAANGAPGQVLEPQTAAAWRDMVADAASRGVTLRPEPDNGVASCYRSLSNQQSAFGNQPPTAAVPGTSNHGTGIAVDLVVTDSSLNYLRANAARFGFDNTEGAGVGESWHWVRTASYVSPETITKAGEDMALTIQSPQGDVYTVAPEYCRHEASKDTVYFVTDVLTAEDRIVVCDQVQFNSVLAALGIPASVPPQCLRGKAWSMNRQIRFDLGKIASPFEDPTQQ